MKKILPFILFLTFMSCNNDESRKENFFVDPDNYFRIESNINPPHSSFEQFSKLIDVFGVKIYAMHDVGDVKLLHAANVMAQYLDNDDDGQVDDQNVLECMLERNASVIMVKHNDHPDLEKFFRSAPFDTYALQDLYDSETVPGGYDKGIFDASLEEILHIINFSGHVHAYPDAFGLEPGSLLCDAMDIARGGQFETIPADYPEGAWYSYDDETCEYDCMAIEYLYWALTSMLGAQDFEGRLERIEHEWKLNTFEKVRDTDPAIFSLLTDPEYKMPSRLPDGKYRQD